MYFIIIIAIVVLDQTIRLIIAGTMELHQSIPVIDQFFYITYIENNGAAFSMLEGFRVFLILFSAAVTLAALVYLFLKRKTGVPLVLTSLSFIIGGGLGNLIDRVFFGSVTDYFDVPIFAVFNVADIFVCVGCGLLLLQVLVFDRSKTKSEKK